MRRLTKRAGRAAASPCREVASVFGRVKAGRDSWKRVAAQRWRLPAVRDGIVVRVGLRRDPATLVTFLAGRTLSAQRRLRASAMDADLGRGARESEGHDLPRGVEPAVPGSRWSSDRCCEHRTSSLCAIRLSAESSDRLLPWPTWTTASGPAAISSPAVWNLRRRHDWASGYAVGLHKRFRWNLQADRSRRFRLITSSNRSTCSTGRWRSLHLGSPRA